MSNTASDKGITIQLVSGIAIIIAQGIFLFSLLYWFGFSSVIGINVIQNFSFIQVFASIADQRIAFLFAIVLLTGILQVLGYSGRNKHYSFIDDIAVKVPPNALMSDAAGATLGVGERYMTNVEIDLFRRWVKRQKLTRVASFISMILCFIVIVYLWEEGNRADSIRLSVILAFLLSLVVATSDTLAFISLSLRSTLTSLLLICSMSAEVGALDADNLRYRGESSSFPQVAITIDGQTNVGQLITHGQTDTLVMDDLRRFEVLPSRKITEIRYLRH